MSKILNSNHSSAQSSPFFLTIVTFLVAAACSLVFAVNASAHGYVESPTGRSLACKEGLNKNCGAVQYEPQSMEAVGSFPKSGPADGEIAGAGIFKELFEQSSIRLNKVTLISGKQTFKWKLTANHATKEWKYYITKKDWDPNKPLTRASLESEPFCYYNDGGAKPQSSVAHECNVPSDRSGYHIILGVWEIADTVNAFYQVMDVNLVNDGSVPSLPSAPNKLESTIQTIKSVVLNWLPASGSSVKEYEVFRGAQWCGTTTHTTFMDSGLTPDTSYTYTVRAIDFAGNKSPFSVPITVRTLKETTEGELPGEGNGGNGGSTTLPGWSSSTVYVQGNKVSYNGFDYAALYWTQNNRPDISSAWKLLSLVVPEWNSTKAYTGGTEVTYNIISYIAKWWTMGEKPDQGGVWKKAS